MMAQLQLCLSHDHKEGEMVGQRVGFPTPFACIGRRLVFLAQVKETEGRGRQAW